MESSDKNLPKTVLGYTQFCFYSMSGSSDVKYPPVKESLSMRTAQENRSVKANVCSFLLKYNYDTFIVPYEGVLISS
jgi:hypothetical protein